MIFDEIVDLSDGVHFSFYNIPGIIPAHANHFLCGKGALQQKSCLRDCFALWSVHRRGTELRHHGKCICPVYDLDQDLDHGMETYQTWPIYITSPLPLTSIVQLGQQPWAYI